MDRVAQWIGIISGVLGILGFFGIKGFRRPEWAKSRDDLINKMATGLGWVGGLATMGALFLPWSYASGNAGTVTTGAFGTDGVSWVWQYTVADLALGASIPLMSSVSDVATRKAKLLLVICGGGAAIVAALVDLPGTNATARIAGAAETHVLDRVGFDVFAVGAVTIMLGSLIIALTLAE